MAEDKIDELTAFEVTQAEKACGVPFEFLADEGEPRPGRLALLGALAWTHKKRTEPTLTYVDYMKSVKHDEITEYLFPDDDEEQTEDGTSAGFPEPVGPDQAVADPGPGEDEGGVLPGDGRPAE